MNAEYHYQKTFSNYFPPRDFENDKYIFEELPIGKEKKMARINELLYGRKRIRTGYAATSIRGSHTYHVRY